jgi:hypothetical protein
MLPEYMVFVNVRYGYPDSIACRQNHSLAGSVFSDLVQQSVML